ncbi:F-actin-monooxygenase MICAL2 isoform X4 [Rhinatrema bivittatum]|uniref:F-actin-monooxygenase MICAL2 isoform X4 n=1 Tax=Rhinatrema bivittatum TaxID=194408 RepID=UPI0011266B93|nr:F-actin-monooxygenase MICAL2 isoform X4 [Rhinatrema bivittatum]
MGENEDEKPNQSGQLFENFVQAATCKGTLQAFNILARQLDLDPLDYRHFYPRLKSKITTWKAKALWNKLDKRGCHKEYKRGKSCVTPKCLIIGGGPCGLRTAIELAYLGAKVVVVEKRDTFSRNNVLHLWPFTIHDLRGLGAKKFYGKFCAGSIDHISIRQLQLILFKVALLLGVEIHVNLEFLKVVEPPEDHENQKVGWRAEFLPVDHPLSEYEFDVIIGADGRRNTLEGFGRKEFRGKLAIAITANFVNRNTTAEAKVEEISGVAFIFNQKFFQDLKEETGIDLENIVYYKDSTHYFVMTAKKQSLLDKGVIINDYIDTEVLLCGENVNQENLQSYAREAADFATNYQLPSLDFAITHYGQPDVAMFDFTSMYASKNAALVRERRGHHLLVCLVGDSLLEPFWPMGTGCARGFLAAFDSAWMVKSWAQETPPLEILAERESLYRLLPQTTPENINKNFDQYTIDPGTRYPNLNSNCVRPHQVRHLYLTNELQHCPLERVSSIRRSVGLSRHESDIRPNKLLTWCQKQTEGYRNVNVINLTSSWKSGFALCAIIHRFRPDDIDFEALNEEDPVGNNQLAFDIAERELGIPPITTGKEMAGAEGPDKLSMVMYLSKFYELFRGAPLRAVDPASKENGENGNAYPAKSTTLNNFINLTAPRKRVTKVERRAEESDMHKRRRKGLRNFEEPSSFSSQSASSGSEHGDSKESQNQNKVKSMATQLLAKFEENAPNASLRRQNKLPPPGLSHFQPKTPPYALPSPSHDSAASSSSSPADSVPSSGHSGKVTVGKVASGIGAVAEVLINLYMNDHRPKSCSDSMARNHLADGAIPAAASFPDPSLSSPLQNPKGSLRKEFPANLGGSDICYFCKKRVYVMERQSAEGHFFHRECFRCDFCSTTIRPGVFAYDVDEGKFYCKPHFMHCKKHNKHRKRRAELKAQDDDEMWKNETPEPSAAESMYPVSSQEDGPPDWQLIDETMSPKKSKNELEHCDFESRLSSADSTSEWTSVKVAPEEAMTDHNLLAIRVMVTSDGSSSDMESDNCDDLGNSGLCKESYFFPETVSSKKLLKRHVSMNDGGQQEKRNIKSRALDALQRASSFHSSTSSACQKWRERTLSRWAPIIGKKSEEPSKESAPCIPDALEEDHSQGEMPSQDPPSEIARWRNEFNTPTLQEKVSEEVLPYKPHSSHLLNRTSDSLLVDNDHYPSKNVRLYDEHSLIQECQDEKTKIGEHDLEEMNVYSKELPTQTDASIDRSMELSSRNAAKRDERGRGEQKEMTDQVSNEKLKRLVLSEEEKSMLLDWNSENVTPAKSENQTTDVLEKSVSKKGYNKKGKKPKPLSLTVSSEIANDSSLSFSKDQEDELRIPKADNTAGAGTDSKLKSPFKLFASAIKRSILEQLSPTPDNAKRTPDDKSKLISPSSDTDFPSPIVSSGVLRRGQSNKEYSSKSPGSFLFLNTEKVGKTSNSPSKPSTSSSNERETPSFDYGTPRRDFSTYATYSRLSEEPCKPTHDNSPYTKMEDFMPKLLEKFSLKENSSKEVMDDSQTRKRKNTLFSSLRLKDRAAVTDEKNIWNLFGSLRKKATEKETSDPLNRSSTPLFASSTSSSFSEQEAGSSNARDRTQVNEDSSASSGDEFHHNPSPPLKLKTPSKRRKKQEREAKQRAKQEEMRRLHKAQGIQRQLHEIEERQRSLEAQGVELEKALRGESDSETQDESQLLQEWFKLVLEKNKLARCESELLIIGQELELEDHQSRLEQKLREKMSVNVRQKDEKSREEEQEIFTEMMRVIEERDNLVSFLEQQRLEEKAEEKSFENFALSRGYQPSTDTHTGMRML